jgi:hypothetical protein
LSNVKLCAKRTSNGRHVVSGVVLSTSLLLPPSSAGAAAVLRSADIRIVVTSPTACEVTMALTIDGAAEIDHRIEAFEGSGVELIALRHARQQHDASVVGRTRSLVLRQDQPAYELRYRAQQPASRASRCPLWVPAVPTDGHSRAVRLYVELPPSTTAVDAMPAFVWAGNQGSTTLGNIPAFVRMAYTEAGDAAPWNVRGSMDAIAVAVFVVASALWVWRGRR